MNHYSILSEKISKNFNEIFPKLNPDDGSDISMLCEKEKQFILAMHAAEYNGRNIYEFVKFLDSPEWVYQFYFWTYNGCDVLLLKDIKKFMKTRPDLYTEEMQNDPYNTIIYE
jgi:hypothetical protein